MLAKAVEEEHHRLIRSSLGALRQLLNTFRFAVGRSGSAEAALLGERHMSETWEDGLLLRTLLLVIQKNPSRETAFDAFRIIRLGVNSGSITTMGGYTQSSFSRFAACVSAEALESLLYLAGSVPEYQSGTAVESCWTLSFISQSFALGPADVAARLVALPIFWPLLLTMVSYDDNTVARQAYAEEENSSGKLRRPKLAESATHSACELIALTLTHAPASKLPKYIPPVLLADLCSSLSLAPTDPAVADAIIALLSVKPEVVCEALKFDLKLDLVRTLCSTVATQPNCMRALRAIAGSAGSAAAPIISALLPAQLRATLAFGAAPASAAALEELESKRLKRVRLAQRAEDTATDEEVRAEAMSASLPLWKAAQAAGTGRARIALARANAMLRAAELRRSRSMRNTETKQVVSRFGHFIIALAGEEGSLRTTDGFHFTIGMHHTTGAPELVVLADIPNVPAQMQCFVSASVIKAAASLLIAEICAGEEDERIIAARICSREAGWEVADSQIGVFSSTQHMGMPALQTNSVSLMSPELCAAASAVVWRFVPARRALTTFTNPAAAWCGKSGAANGRFSSVFYGALETPVAGNAFFFCRGHCSL